MICEDCLLYGGACGMMVSGRPLVRCESAAPEQNPCKTESEKKINSLGMLHEDR